MPLEQQECEARNYLGWLLIACTLLNEMEKKSSHRLSITVWELVEMDRALENLIIF